jgi:lactoylglutathione lyase
VRRAISFYEEAFQLKVRFVHESGDYAEMETGPTILSFSSYEMARSNLPDGFQKNDPAQPPAGLQITFTTADVPAAFAHALKVGAVEAARPECKPWGQEVAFVRDPDGILVEIATPL